MPTMPRTALPRLILLLVACTALLALTAFLLGGSPTARARATPRTEAAGGSESASRPFACVVIDAGHGGEDGGASSAAGLVEKNVNLAVSFALRDLLEAAGVPVVMTRTEDKLLYDRNMNYQGRKKVLDLAARRLVAEKTAAEYGGDCLFISIHMNAFPQPQYSGMQVWYGTGDPRSADAAETIQAASVSLMPNNHRKIKPAGSSIYLLDRIKTPAVLVECGFLSNPDEAARLGETAYQNAIAAAIFSGIVPYLSP